jgi:transglutaminase-like putative cysteine protease
MIKSRVVFQLKPQTTIALLVVQCLNIACLILELSPWLLALTLLCFIWHWVIYNKKISRPSRALKLLLAIVGCVLLVVTAKTLGLLLSMVHLLCLAYILKPFELRQRKDFYQLQTLGLFVLASSLIFQQSIYFALLILTILIANISVLISYFYAKKPMRFSIKLSLRLIVQSLPLALMLFVLFPKLSPFWQVPLAKSATTGLSDTVAVGDISNLALSNELAFRVEFENNPPSYQQLYWRTLVLDTFSGTHWSAEHTKRVKDRQLDDDLLASLSSSNVVYQVIAEPSYQHWLFGLGISVINNVSQNKKVYSLDDHTLYSQRKIAQPISYQVTSYLNEPLNLSLSLQEQRDNTQVPMHSNPRLVNYAKELRAQYQDNQQLIQAVMLKFNQDNYRYTLKPPSLTNHSLDEFYFDTQAGFCEHYASSFTYLMRAAGIPARLVLGYLGGEHNEQGNYYSIYQRDAHAWSEVWLIGQGWVRIDPTAAVNPERVEKGFSSTLLLEQQSFSDDLFNFELGSIALYQAIRWQLDALDYQWTKWVIGYSQKRQLDLLSQWFKGDINIKAALLITFSFITVMLFLWWINSQRKAKPEQEAWIKYYQQSLLLLAKLNIVKTKGASVDNFQKKVKQKHPYAAVVFSVICQQFSKLQYEKLNAEQKQQAINLMKDNIKQLKVIVISKGSIN